MTTNTLRQRLERIEARRDPARVVVCWCNPAGDGGHAPDCAAATAGDSDRVLVVRWADGDD